MAAELLGSSPQAQELYRKLSLRYLSVYLVVMGADWLQGPYLYKLYRSFGFDLVDIAFLFLTGFVSGAIGGTIASSTADTWGRRRVCIAFCGTAVLALVMRLRETFGLLFMSHVLSGMAASMQHSVFEAWYVSAHARQDIPEEWMASTFATGTFLNGLVAILAGMVANNAVDLWGLKAPFVLAIVLLIIAAFMITCLWSENYGDGGHGKIQLRRTLIDGFHALWTDSNILVLGAAQTMFECAMYIFVLLYTPSIESAASIYSGETAQGQEFPFGYLFSTLMCAVMSGSMVFQKLEEWPVFKYNKERILMIALGIASGAFVAMVYNRSTSFPVLLIAYHVFEFTTGLYYPSFSWLRAEVIPEETRASVMTLLRIPMNIGVGIVMWHVSC
ncbi:hypothetical protein BX666DRAFT_427213 [Dichotomocladium elegans]|nr:hypothetical protein BX666DRAFT_427213 [Dichotomocladium elegans]